MTDDAMADEFDVVAEWTADVALDLGPEYRIPAGCRGSGSPAGLLWLAEHLDLRRGESLLDVGAGVGGPGAFVAEALEVRPVLSEPAAGACRAAVRLFDLPVVQCSATALPWRDGASPAAWSLGVLCTIPRDQQATALAEMARVLAPGGRLGLLVFVAATDPLPFQPEGNAFPTRERLHTLLRDAGLDVGAETTASDLSWESEEFDRRAGAVEDELGRRHADDERWRTAEHQSELIGRLIGDGQVVPTYLAAVRT
ncbi:methyltransferase domain-containing protein [Jatrophihabitans sp. YIM 134969]